MLTRRQTEILEFIRAYTKAYGMSPSFKDLRVGCGISSNAIVWRLLKELEDKSLISRIPMMQRCIELAETADFHLAGCECEGCAQSRYLRQVKLIEAVQNDPPALILRTSKTNFRLLSREKRRALNTPQVQKRARTAQPSGVAG